MTEHTYRQFDADIDSIRSAFTTMGGLVERQLLRAIDAVRYGDLRLTTVVLVDERQINQMQVESDLRCNQIIAKRQPIAIDLREIIGVIHGVNDLERIGDEVRIHASARSFLHHQVRSIVGSLQLVGSDRWTRDELGAALEARDRSRCGPMAPACGLYLIGVDYPPTDTTG